MSTGKNLRVVDVADLQVIDVRLEEVSSLCNAISRLSQHPECDRDDDIRCLAGIAVNMVNELAESIVALGVPVSGEVAS